MRNLKILIFIAFCTLSCNKEQKSPNFIFIYTDDQRFDTVGIIGNNQVITPNLDKLAKSGAVLSNTYNMGAWHGAVCVASRAMIISGKSVWRAKDEVARPIEEQESVISNTWPRLFKKDGYRTFMSGKWHVNLPVKKLFDVVANERPGMPDDNRVEFSKQFNVWKKNSGDLKQLRANIINLQNRIRALGQKSNKPIIQKLDQSSKSSILNNSYSVKKITFKYGGSPGGLPNLNLLTRVELLLSFSNKLISLGDLIIGKSERFNLSLKDFNILSEVPLQYLKSFGYEGVVVFPSPNDIDPVSGADLRTGGDDNLTFVIWVSKLKTISVDAAKIKKSKKVVSRINELSESYLQEKSSKSNFLKQEDIRYLRRWGASPSRNAQVSLSPGKKAGDVNATIKLEPLKSNKVAIQTANSGSSATGEWIFDLSAVNHQLTGADDQLGVMLSSSQTFERQSLVAFYKRPIIYPNLLEFGASIGHSKYDASAFALTQFDFQGETSAADLQLSWKPLTTEKDAWSIGFDSGLRLENVKASNSLISDFADTYVLSPNLIFRINTRATYLKTQSSISLVGNILAIDQSDQGALGGVNTNEKYVRLNFSYLESLHLGKWLVDTFPNSFDDIGFWSYS